MRAGAQHFWLTGSRLYFKRDPITVNGSAVDQPIIDFGVIEPVSPNVTTEEATLEDSDGGIRVEIASEITKTAEDYDIRCSNLNMKNLSFVFNASGVTSFTQASTTLTDVQHNAVPGHLVKLTTAAGVLIYGLASITSAKLGSSGSTALVEGTDFEVVSLERGLIRMLASSIVFTAAGPIRVTMVPRAITGERLITPGTESCSLLGTGLLVWGRCGNREQTVREVRVRLKTNGSQFGVQSYSNFSISMKVLSDPTLPTPRGRLLYWLGDLPSLS